jgi:hypothetical protein
MSEAVKGVLRTLCYWAGPSCIAVLLVWFSLATSSWLPIVLGVGIVASSFIVAVRRRETKHLELELKGLVVSPELQEQRLKEYLESLKSKKC